MNSDVLERLLIDHDAGELSPDVEELLEHHLRQEPAAQSKAAEMSATLQLARLALAGEPLIGLPRRQQARSMSTWVWGVAACLLCAGLLGLFAVRDRRGSSQISNSAPAREAGAAPATDEPGFWSGYRLRAAVSSSRPSAANRIFWKSPVRKPELFTR